MANRTSKTRPRRTGLKNYCRKLAGVTEDIKWTDNYVFSVGGRMFATFNIDDEKEFGFLCDDDDFDLLTEEVEGVIPAPYAARLGWVKVTRDALMSNAEVKAYMAKAHRIAASKLSNKKQRELGIEPGNEPA